MNVKVSGISFDEESLDTKLLAELKVDSISSSYLFLKIQQKYYLMLRAADYIDAQFKEKYNLKGIQSFYSYNICDQQVIQKYENLWSELKISKLENEKISVIENIFIELTKDFWAQTYQVSFINFISACYNQFYHLDKQVVQNLQSTSHVLYSRAIQVGAHAVIAALANGYTDYYFIKDLYNASFALDYGLISKDFNWNLVQACEHERNNPQLGKSSLKNILKNSSDYQLFINHPLKTVELLKRFEKNFTYPEIIWAIKVHHEKANGTGFPKGINYSSISTWESVIQYADYAIAFEEKFYQKDDGVDSFKNTFQNLFMSPYIKSLPVFRVVQNISKYFKWAEKKLNEEEVAS